MMSTADRVRITIVTATYNAEDHVKDCIDSVQEQQYTAWEHRIIDGDSDDGTAGIVGEVKSEQLIFNSEPDGGIYDAMNKGIAAAEGEVVGILNADDIYSHDEVLLRVAEVFQDRSIDACYANLSFVRADDLDRVVRHWVSEPYRPGLFLRGWMLPHPTLFVRKRVYEEFGAFDSRFAIGGDWDLMLRLFEKKHIKSEHISDTWVRMRLGGASTGSFLGIVRNNLENLIAFPKNGLLPHWSYPFYRVYHRTRQLHV